MSKQAIVLLFNEAEELDKIRKEYSPDADKFKPHLSLVYPFEVEDQKGLKEHIKKSLEGIYPFKLIMKGLGKSVKEFYLYLLVDQGMKEIMNLYDRLNSEILSEFENPDMPKYIPHITLGVFNSLEEIYEAKEKLKDLEYEVEVGSIQLLTLNEDDSIKEVENFSL